MQLTKLYKCTRCDKRYTVQGAFESRFTKHGNENANYLLTVCRECRGKIPPSGNSERR